jgi:FRG domain
MKIKKATSIIDGFRKAADLIEKWSTPTKPAYCWFRGVNDRMLTLKPGAVWRTGYQEYEAMVSFVQEGVAFTNIGSIRSWDTYYLAQHYGMPTRLLDWTESFGAAMFFALDGVTHGNVPCVWVLQPEKINEQYLNWHGIMAPENLPELDAWLPGGIRKPDVKDSDGYRYDNLHTLSIYAKKSNHRIIAQQGAFTLHGRDDRSLCEMVANDFVKPETVLARIDFENIDIEKAKRHLETLGVRRSAIYPDIDNFVKQLGDYYWPKPGMASKASKKTAAAISRPLVKGASSISYPSSPPPRPR